MNVVERIPPSNTLSKYDSHDYDDGAENGMGIVHKLPVLLGITLCHNHQKSNNEPGPPHSPSMTLHSLVSVIIYIKFVICFNLSGARDLKLPESVIMRLELIKYSVRIVAIAHLDLSIKRNDEVFIGVASVERPSCNESDETFFV